MKRLFGVKTLGAAVAVALVFGFASTGFLFAQAAPEAEVAGYPADHMGIMTTPESGPPMAGRMPQMMQECMDMMQMTGMMNGQMSGMGSSEGTPTAARTNGMMGGTPRATPAN